MKTNNQTKAKIHPWRCHSGGFKSKPNSALPNRQFRVIPR